MFELQALLIALAITGLFLGVVVDERHHAAQELRDTLRLAAAGEMSAAIAHELNQPLTALANYARAGTLIVDAAELDRPLLRETLQRLLAESGRAADVVRRLRDFFRTGSTILRPVALPALAATACESLRERAEAAGVSIEQRVAGVVNDVVVDPLQIQIVLRNLLANSLEAAADAPEPRQVSIEIAGSETGEVTTIVRDSGRGVAPNVGERVFEPFWTSRASGMGSGSRSAGPSSKPMAESCGPRPADAASSDLRCRLAMTDRSTLTVFVVDDDAAIRDSLGLLLGLSGYRCAQFASGEAFLAAFRPEWRGCVLADLRMPGMDGLQLQEAIARGSDIPFVMITAHGDVAAARQAFKLRAVDFLEKPFTDEAVIAAIETAFGAEVSRSRESTAHAARDRLLAALTEREREVAMLVVQGMHNRDIGTQLGIRPRTVEVHKARIMEKCGAGGLADLIRLFHAAPAPRERRGP